jgi:putative transposase
VVEAEQAVLTGTVTALAAAGTTVVHGCALVGLPRSTYYRLHRGYRHYRPVAAVMPHAERRQPAALSPAEMASIIAVLTADNYADLSVVQAYWLAFDAGQVCCSQRTFYRVAKAHRLVGDRRRTRPHGSRSRRAPAVAATQVGDLWSWDVTELRGPGSRDRYYLYLIIDVFSRYPVGWCIEYQESKERAVALFADAIAVHGAPKVIHSDNGSIMRSELLVTALVTAGTVTSYSRPRVSDDNPFSESLFKTIKYAIDCPDRFDGIDHARRWTDDFLHGYASKHRHSGLGRHTPASVHFGTAEQIHRRRQETLDLYWEQHPERFRRRPTAPELPQQTGINTHLLSQTG